MAYTPVNGLEINGDFASGSSSGDIEMETARFLTLDENHKCSLSLLPTSRRTYKIIAASEVLAAGDFVQIYDNSGTPAARKADASDGKLASGYVRAAYDSGASATVYTSGVNDMVSGRTAGRVWLGESGAATQTEPTSGWYQEIGVALSATEIDFDNGFSFKF